MFSQVRLLIMVIHLFVVAAVSIVMAEEDGKVGVEVLAILNRDEQGEKLKYPSSVTYDSDMDEIYVVGGGEGKVVVYGSNFFPTVSLSHGRDADSPRGVYIDRTNMVYLCQAATEDKPARLTMYNPAFFPQKEIAFTAMPEGDNFIPIDMVKGLGGQYYLVGQNTRGVLVLNKEGNYSHWLKPKDTLFSEESGLMTRDDGAALPPELTENLQTADDGFETGSPSVDMRDLLPSELLPQLKDEGEAEPENTLVEVQIADVTVDSAGHIYLLSEETSKIYVYSHAEEFLYSFGQKGGSTGKMSRPKSLVVDENKKALYVVDYMRHTILIFDLGGKFMYEFGGMGTGAGWFQFPVGLALNKEGHLIVADLFNQRVQVLDINFEYKFPLFPETDVKENRAREIEHAEPEDREEEVILQPAPILL